jgi:EmrB/QacA subfamily drug resistance transporter
MTAGLSLSTKHTAQRRPRRDFGEGAAADAKYANNVLFVVSISTILTALSGGLLNISLPVVVRHFHASTLQASWLLLGAMLTSTSLIILFGRLADMFGRRSMYLTGLGLMTATSLAAGVAPSVDSLILIRMLQAAGTAMLLANMAAMLTLAFPPEKLAKVMGIYMSALSSATLAGPPVGAILAETVGWRWIFGLQVPVGAFCFIWALLTLRPMPAMGARGRLDVPGVILVVAVLSGMILGLSQLQTSGFHDPLVIAGFAVFVLGLPVFVLVESHTHVPLVDLRLFARASVAASNAAMFFGNMARFAADVAGGLYFQAVDGNSTLTAALKVLPMPICTTLAGLSMGRLSRFGSQRAIATAASTVSALGVVLLLFAFGSGAPYPVIGLGFLIIGIGGGVFMPANTTAILQEVPRERLGVVNAVRMMLMSSGSLIATALSLALITSTLPHSLRSAVFAGNVSKVAGGAVGELRDGYTRAMIVLLLLNVIGILACVISQRAYARSTASEPASDE